MELCKQTHGYSQSERVLCFELECGRNGLLRLTDLNVQRCARSRNICGPVLGLDMARFMGPVSMWTALDYALVAPRSPVQAQRRAMRDREKFEFHQNHAVGVSSDWFGLGLPHVPGWKEWELLQQARKIPRPNYRSVLFIDNFKIC